MKILYVKNNSERAKEFQLKTIIYEEDGQKFVKKQAMCSEAISHLKKMKATYDKLTESIIAPHIKLAKIIYENADSLTFEFIDGISLEHTYNMAKKQSELASKTVVDTYMELLKKGFKTIPFDSHSMVTDTFKYTFGDFDYSQFDGDLCFEGISNIDLIFSNIIYKEDTIYLIDYEWVYDLNIPIDFAAFRTLHEHNDLHWAMEKHFVFNVVVNKDGFLNVQKHYEKLRLTGLSSLKEKDTQISNLETIVIDKESVINDKEVHIESLLANTTSIIHDKDVHIESLIADTTSIIHDKDVHIKNQTQKIHSQTQEIYSQTQEIQDKSLSIKDKNKYIQQLQGDIEHWHNVAKTMTIKGRTKTLLKKIFPLTFLKKLQSLKHRKNILKMETPSGTIDAPIPPVINNYHYVDPILSNTIKEEIEQFKNTPLISIIMPVYNVEPKWLELAITSIKNQWYTNWELCLSDDKSTNQATIDYLKSINHPQIKVKFLEKNGNISVASNAALTLTSGEYIGLMDNDDEITPNALYEVVKAINGGAEFVYSDEDKIEMDGSFSDPHFKPDFAPEMFLSQNYLSHFGVTRKDLITKVGGFTVGLEGSQDFDLYLKILEHTDKIHHITKVLYHWRKIPGSTATEYGEKSYAQEAGRKAIENAMYRRGIKASVKNGQTAGTYKVDYDLTSAPLVSIIIPFKNKPDLLKACIESIINKSTYENYEIIGISNNSDEDEIFKEMKRLETLDSRISFYEYNVAFNYSDINNHAVEKYANGEQILFLNNDIEIITPSWIEELLMYSQQSQNGAIGAKLYFPNDTIQHAGIVLVPNTIHSAILMYQGYPRGHFGYISRAKCVNNYSAVTAACLMVKRILFDKVGGFDKERLSIAYNDVDLCLRLQEAGYKNVWTPYCEAYHHESVSRGYEINVDAVERREKEKWNLKDKHKTLFTTGDPHYNKNLTRFGVNAEPSDFNTIHHESVNGITFYENLISTQNLKEKSNNRICIFSHFDAQNEIKEYVQYYLKELSQIADILFVSTAEELSSESTKCIESYCRDIIIKKNVGYDFGAWKTGLDYLSTPLDSYEELILCNDSVYGPFYDLKTIFDKMQGSDLWAMTDNHEIEYHLQSYFMVYTKKAFTHDVFKMFWDTLKIYTNKQMLIENNEIGYSKALISSDLSYATYYSCKDKNYVNVLQYYWDELVSKYKFPFIKKEVLTTNPLQLDTSNWKKVVQDTGSYDTTLIPVK